MKSQHWIVKQEPEDYSWSRLVADRRTSWTGIRNFLARNHLRAMNVGDPVFYYHSGREKCIVGLAQVARAAYPDPTATDGDWSAIDLVPVKPLARPIPLAEIKSDPQLQSLPLLKHTRLSVSPVPSDSFKRILSLSNLTLPA